MHRVCLDSAVAAAVGDGEFIRREHVGARPDRSLISLHVQWAQARTLVCLVERAIEGVRKSAVQSSPTVDSTQYHGLEL
jgi:hypothetical protein